MGDSRDDLTPAFLRERELRSLVPFSSSTLWREVKAGRFPAPVRLSPGVTAWRAQDVQAWAHERSNGSGASDGPDRRLADRESRGGR